eukprot:Tamp_21791.p1 GENE.Tamp_21791~~Tamp_21791.p1  ORF type:complete len:351 (-),score=93.53 Tamp_21791:71-1033(-)
MAFLTEKEAVEMRGKLEKEDVSVDTARQVLEALLDKSVTIKVLLDTKIGMTVKAKRKHADSKVAEMASTLTSKWKEVVEKCRAGNGGSTPKASNGGGTPKASGEASASKRVDSTSSKEKVGKGAPEPKKEKPAVPKMEAAKTLSRESSTSSVSSDGGVGKRDKVRQLLEKSLGVQEGVDVVALAREIEEALYKKFDGTNEEYTAQVKTVKFNMTDPKNKDFRRLVLSGEITAEQIPCLTSQQMAGKDKIEQKKANMEAKIFQDKMFITAGNLGAESDMFKCSKCKQSRTSFYQKQTRSADEPMTVFITCKVCGHEWRDGG